MTRAIVPALISVSVLPLLVATYSAQAPASHTTPPARSSAKVDFARDVRPIFERHCYDCHGPEKQMNGFRLDRRREAMRGGTAVVIGPGSAMSSRLYLRLVGTTYGRRMPIESEPLSAPEIDTVRAWIDQGAEWPDAVSGDVTPLPLDAAAVKAFDALRTGDRSGFLSLVGSDSRLPKLRGPGGATPLMAAALSGDAALVRTLLDRGADPNAANDAGATPLMWAVGDLEKTRLLVDRGADVNARSNDGRHPLVAAASIRGNSEVVALLLDRGADPSVQSSGGIAPITAISEAAKQGDEAMIRLLISRGSDVGRGGFAALAFAIRAQCDGCVEAIASKLAPPLLTRALALAAPPLGAGTAALPLLKRGADANARNPLGYPVLVLTAASDDFPVEAVKALLARGADLHATGPHGETALAVARRHGHTPVVDALLKAGAADRTIERVPPLPFAPAHSPRAAVARSLPLLQRADVGFMQKAGCVSCHNNAQTAETVSLARSRGFALDEGIARRQLERIAAYADDWRERNLLGQGIPGDSNSMAAILNGLAAERHQPDLTTDALARFIRLQQVADGSWRSFGRRPPIGTGDITLTVAAIRSLQAYAAPYDRAAADAAIRRAAAWLPGAEASDTQELAFKVIGLHTVRAARTAIAAAGARLASGQRPDGGWSQLPTLGSDAYATGEALVALLTTGAAHPGEPVVRRGVQYLLKTQLEDGSWFVTSRAIPLQPHFEADFPHGRNQFISAAATNWATQALIYADTGRAGTAANRR